MKIRVFRSILDQSYKDELERLLFFNQNQDRFRSDVLLLIQRYGMAHVETIDGRIRVVLESAPEPQTLYMLERSNGHDQLVGVMVYLRENDSLSLVIAAAHEDYVSIPLMWTMIDVLRDIARQVKGVSSVTIYPGTRRERKLPASKQTGFRALPTENVTARRRGPIRTGRKEDAR